MKHTILISFSIISLLLFAFVVKSLSALNKGGEFVQVSNKDSGYNQQQNEAENEGKIIFYGSIDSVRFNECDIVVKSTNGEFFTIGQLSSLGQIESNCIKSPKYAISKSLNYLLFEDVAGGIDLWVRVFSASNKSLDTLGVWGTADILDMEPLSHDRIAILTGSPNDPPTQSLYVYNLTLLYENYPQSLDEYGYFTDRAIEYSSKNLPIASTVGDFFRLYSDSTKLYVLGGDERNPTILGEFSLTGL